MRVTIPLPQSRMLMHLLLTVLFGGVLAFESTCSTDCHSMVGESLLQAKSGSITKKHPTSQKARDVLPESLVELGLQVFGDEPTLDKVVTEAREINVTYAGVPLVLRILANDSAEQRIGGQDEDGAEYGLDTVLDVLKDSDGMVNVIDMGANYGVVGISVFNKFAGRVRAILIEPVAVTYFFLRWNFEINNVPYLSKKAWLSDSKTAGVHALHAAVTAKAGEDIQMCSHPSVSMNSRTSDSVAHPACNCSFETCDMVSGVSTEGLMNDYFENEDITLLKMDCEGCEFKSLPAVANHHSRIRRLVGELHIPTEDLIDIACEHEEGRYMTKVCRIDETNWKAGLPLNCTHGRKKCNW
jgi:FkbM family methyltransferase